MIDGKGYWQIMDAYPAHLTLKLDTAEPVEIADFVGAFTSIANEFERYVEQSRPGLKADTRIYIKEVRSGRIEADMIGAIFSSITGAITIADQTMIVEDFVKRWSVRLGYLISNKIPHDELTTRRELKDFFDATQSIACDPAASHRLEAACYEDGKRNIRASFEFSAVEARAAQQTIVDRQKLLALPGHVQHLRVLMIYTRTDIHDAKLNKKSAERVLIRSISEKEMPVMYASEIAEQEIREHIRDADENVYKRGFVVDVSAEMSGEKIVAYAITNFHSVIDLD